MMWSNYTTPGIGVEYNVVCMYIHSVSTHKQTSSLKSSARFTHWLWYHSRLKQQWIDFAPVLFFK
jgi:hypothetical protein